MNHKSWKRGIGWYLAAVLASVAVLTGCGSAAGQNAKKEDDGKLNVVTTLFPYYDFARQIAGDAVDLTMVVPAGMDSHSFEPTPADMRTIQNADVLICNGGAMEQWLTQVLAATDTDHMTVITMMDYVDTYEEEIVEGMEDEAHDHAHGSHGHDHESEDHDHEAEENHDHDAEDHDHESETDHDHDALSDENGGTDDHAHDHDSDSALPDGHYYGDGHDHSDYVDDDGHHVDIEYDEHVWTSPVNAMKFTEVIADTLSKCDPVNETRYEEGKEAYLKELEALHEGFLEVSKNRRRNMIVVGDKFPFRYLAEEYGFDYRAAFSGCSTDTEPSAKTIAYLIDKVRTEEIPVVYYLELSSHRVSEIIGEETGAKPELLHSCHNVTRAEFDSGVTYVDLMKGNIETLRDGLD